jgi:hypothetical protein
MYLTELVLLLRVCRLFVFVFYLCVNLYCDIDKHTHKMVNCYFYFCNYFKISKNVSKFLDFKYKWLSPHQL